jgi:hypothetical protein
MSWMAAFRIQRSDTATGTVYMIHKRHAPRWVPRYLPDRDHKVRLAVRAKWYTFFPRHNIHHQNSATRLAILPASPSKKMHLASESAPAQKSPPK